MKYIISIFDGHWEGGHVEEKEYLSDEDCIQDIFDTTDAEEIDKRNGIDFFIISIINMSTRQIILRARNQQSTEIINQK